jgi:molybdopterin-guanine dinucleotide biosynthesis protein A
MAEHRTKMKGTGRMTLSAVLLAGGESRRMGRDKAAIEFEGRPLWERQVEIVRALRPESIFVSARTRPSWLPDEVELLLDDPPSRGPLSGLAKALAVISTTHLIALAVDMPYMTSAQLGLLCGLVAEGQGIVPVVAGRIEPLAAIYPAEAAGDFAAAVAGTDFSLQRVVRKLAADQKVQLFSVPAEHGHFYRSVNEPGDIL